MKLRNTIPIPSFAILKAAFPSSLRGGKLEFNYFLDARPSLRIVIWEPFSSHALEFRSNKSARVFLSVLPAIELIHRAANDSALGRSSEIAGFLVVRLGVTTDIICPFYLYFLTFLSPIIKSRTLFRIRFTIREFSIFYLPIEIYIMRYKVAYYVFGMNFSGGSWYHFTQEKVLRGRILVEYASRCD